MKHVKQSPLFRAPRLKRGHQTVFFGLALLSTTLAAPSVQAGQWVLQHYIADGSRSISEPDAATPNPNPWPSPVLAANAPDGYSVSANRSKSGLGPNANFTVFANNSGSVAAVFRWVTGQGQTLQSDPPPAYLNLLVTSTASSTNSGTVSGSASVNVQAKLNNGVRSLDQINLARNNTVSLNDKKLLRLPAGGEEVTIAYSLLADSKIISTSYNVAGYSGTTYNNANVNVGVNSIVKFKAQEDNRSVKLTRPGARDEAFSILPDGTKVTTSHTRWSYTERTDNSIGQMVNFQDNPVIVTQAINAEPSGPWSPYTNLTGVWSPSRFDDWRPPNQETARHLQDMPCRMADHYSTKQA